YYSLHHHNLHSFPTRRSSDLSRRRSHPVGKECAQLNQFLSSIPLLIRIGSAALVVLAIIFAGYMIYEALRTRSRIREACKLWEPDRKSTRLNSSHVAISYAVF